MTTEPSTANTETDTANAGSMQASEDQSQQTAGSGLSTSDLVSAQKTSGTNTSNTEVETRSTGDSAPLFGESDAKGFRDRWTSIQGSFVDDPRQAVQQADGLVADTIQRLAQMFAQERDSLESQWSSGQDVDTEALRVALQRYRSFFDRLLSV